MGIVRQRKIWFTFSAITMVAAVSLIAIFGLNFGIDFKGGSLMEIEFNEALTRPSVGEITAVLENPELGSVVAQPLGDRGMLLRFKEITETQHQDLLAAMETKLRPEGFEGEVFTELRFDSIGPTIGNELKRKTAWGLIVVVIAIIIYVTWAFRKVSQPVPSWVYGVIAIIALAHDVLITTAVFVLLGKFYGTEINAPFIAAILTILGYSVNDTIVVFDRTRENLKKNISDAFEAVVQRSLSEVMTRSINASSTALFTLFAILLLGGSTIREFVLALIIGISVGTYSSIFIATPLLVTWEKFRSKN